MDGQDQSQLQVQDKLGEWSLPHTKQIFLICIHRQQYLTSSTGILQSSAISYQLLSQLVD
jgi:hypothetical protein